MMDKQEPRGSFATGQSRVGLPSDYIRRIVDLYRTTWEGQFAFWKDVSRMPPAAFTRPQELSEIYGRATDAWGGWFSKLRELFIPVGRTAAAPILEFVVDRNAEISAQQSVRLLERPVAGNPSASDLFPLEASGRRVIGHKHVSVRLEGSELRVGLVDLGHGSDERAARGIAPGRYTAVVFEGAGPVHPLALLDVTFLG